MSILDTMEKAPELRDRRIPYRDIESGMTAGLWHTFLAGFQWRDDLREVIRNNQVQVVDPPSREWWLVPKGSEARRYAVLNRPGLTRDFHRLSMDPTRPAILRFAARYGPLTGGVWLTERGQDGPERIFTLGGDAAEFGEALSMWINETVKFRHLYDLSQLVDRVKKPDLYTGDEVATARRKLATVVEWTDDDAIRIGMEFRTSGGSFKSSSWVTHSALPEHARIVANLPTGDLAAVARYYLMTELNKKLKGSVDPHLLPFQSGALRFVPNSLLTAIYLRLAFEISEGVGRLRECAGCTQPFVPGRKDQRYCGKNCRERAAYRRRTHGPDTERESAGL